jgi:hypothetical protein
MTSLDVVHFYSSTTSPDPISTLGILFFFRYDTLFELEGGRIAWRPR